jgi:hypothetical protein
VTRTTTTWLIAEKMPNLTAEKACFEVKFGLGNNFLAFRFEEINSLKLQLNLETTTSSKNSTKEVWICPL